MPKTSAFVIGERTEREIAMLGEALVRHGLKTAAFVVDTTEDESAGRAAEASGLVLLPPTRCDVPLSEAGKTRFPRGVVDGVGRAGLARLRAHVVRARRAP